MISNTDFALIAALDLNPIKVKLMHKESGEGWTLEHANVIETEYRRFLYLMNAFPDADVAPSVDVDTFWHYHILDTMKYALDCERTFGRFLHHYPYLGLEDDDGVHAQQEAGERARALYESTFGLSYVRSQGADGAVEAADVQTACGSSMPQAANSAWCVGPSRAKAADVQTAWCVGPSRVKAAEAQTAWCVGPSRVKATDVQTAWCVGPSRAKATDFQTTSGIQQAA